VGARVTSELLIGREEALRALDGVLASAEEGWPRTAVLAGESGVGKTRLLAELERRARVRGFIVLHGESIEFGGEEFAYAPVVAALRELPGEWTAEAVADLAPDAREELAGLLPRLALAGQAARHGASSGRFGQGRLHELVLGLLGRLAREEAPLLVALEDLHWADRSTRDFVAFFARNLRTERIAFALTYRTEEVAGESPLRRLLAELMRRADVVGVELAALDRDAVARQLEAIAGAPVQASLVEQLHARGGGNPFFVEELFAAVRAGESGRLPATVAEAVRLRIARLDPPARDLLSTVATAGGRAGYDLLATVTTDVSAALRPGLEAGILVRERGDGGVAFRHGLMGEVVYGDMLPPERTELHLAIARALAATPGATAAPLAHHWHRAGASEEALRASITAGLDAARVYAFSEARGHFERALELWESVALESLPLDKVELLSRAAQAARFTGDHERAVRLGLDALDRLDQAAEPVPAALIYERLGEYHFWDDEAALECYGKALALLPEDPSAERARLLAAEGDALLGLRRWHEAVERCESALAAAGEVAAEAQEANARITLGLTLAFLGRGADGEAEVRRGLELARSLGLVEDIARGYIYLGELLRLRGDRAAALDAMVTGERTAAELGLRGSFGGFMYVNAVEDLVALGRWDDAERRIRGAERMELTLTGSLMLHVNAGRMLALRGDVATARSHLEQAAEGTRDGLPSEIVTPLKAAWAALALVEGRPDDARRHVEDAFATIGEAKDLLYTPHLHALGVRAEAEISERARSLRREPDVAAARSRAETLLADLERTLAQASIDHALPEALAHRALALAEFDRVAGVARSSRWRDAIAAWEDLGEPYHAAYARLREAEAALTAGEDRSAAARLLGEARATATGLGARPLLEDIDALARRARLDLAAAVAEAPAPALLEAGLTAREAEVLALLAEGCTNREIGVRLFISQKTVGAHVAHIFEKLDVHSRLEAAARAQHLGLLERSPSP
jgi:DNA-binding CsgD family transcriptional regulator